MRLTVHRGTDLPKADLIGKIDGYVRVAGACLSGAVVEFGRTPTVKKDFNPSWEHTLEFNALASRPLRLTLMDWDMMSKDDEMGVIEEIPIAPCSQQRLVWKLLGKKTKPSKGSESAVVISVQVEQPSGGLFSLLHSLQPMQPQLVFEQHQAIVSVNIYPVSGFNCFLVYRFNLAGSTADIDLNVVRTDQDRHYLVRLSKPGGVSGRLRTFDRATRVAGLDVFEIWEPIEKLTLGATDFSQFFIQIDELHIKKKQTHLELAQSRGVTLTRPVVHPDMEVKRQLFEQGTAAIDSSKAAVHGQSIIFNLKGDHIKASCSAGKAYTEVDAPKGHKYLPDVTSTFGSSSDRVIAYRGAGLRAEMGVAADEQYQNVTHWLFKVHPKPQIPLLSFCRLEK